MLFHHLSKCWYKYLLMLQVHRQCLLPTGTLVIPYFSYSIWRPTNELVYRACLASKRYIERYVEQGSFPKTLSSFIYQGKEFACHKLYNLNKKRSKVKKETNISYEWLVKQESYGNEKEYQYCDGEIEKTEHNIDNSLIKKSFKQFLKYLPEQSQKIAKKYYGIDSECLSKRQIIKEEKTYWSKLYKVLNNVTTDFAEYYKEREENELEKV